MRWLTWLIPAQWRQTVVPELEEEWRSSRRSQLWFAREAVVIGVRMRLAIGGGALMSDTRYVIRNLWRSRGFTVAAALMLALGVGTNLAVFSVVDRALFRPLPFTAESRLVIVTPYTPEDGQRYAAFDRRLFVAARAGVPALTDMGYVSSFPPRSVPIPGDSGPPLVVSGASYNILDVLGVVPVRGRGFTREDAERREPLALITWETWQARFGGDDSVLGRQIGTAARTLTIAGVLPPGFIRPVMNHWSRSDGIGLDPDLLEGPAPGSVSPSVARLADGATPEQAFAQLTALAERLDPELRRPGQSRGPRVRVDTLRAGMFAFAHQYLWLVALAATLVVCLTAANLSGLLLSRGRGRTHEVALRAALGAGRGRLLMTEFAQSFVICALAAFVAMLLLLWVNHRLVELVPAYMRSFVITGVDGRLLTYAGLLVTLSALFAAGMPAWAASRVDLLSVLQSKAGVPSHARAGRLGRWVIGFEAAVGVVLVASAAIVLRSYIGLATEDLGFQPAGIEQVSIQPTGDREGGDDVAERQRYLGVLDALRARPEVAMAAAGDSTPGSGAAPMMTAVWNGVSNSGLWQVTDQWIETIGARVVAGETIRAVDVREDRPVALVTRDLARRLWPALADVEVLGQTLTAEGQPSRRVIGVLAETRDAPGRPSRPMVVAPLRSDGFWYLDLLARTQPGTVVDTVALKQDVESRYGVTTVTSRAADRYVQSVLQQPRTQVIIFGSFALIGLIVAAVGLFAILSFDLTLRRYEFGIRASLGASSWDLLHSAFVTALHPVALGALIGVGVAYWAAGVVESLVVGVDVRDPWTLGLVVTTLLATAALAAWLPARRASRVDPAVVLRSQ